MSPEKSSESQIVEQLVRDAIAGNSEARDRLFARYGDLIHRCVNGRLLCGGMRLRARESAEDLFQEAAVRVLRNLSGHDWRGRNAFVAWIRCIVEAVVIDKQRFHAAQRRDAGAEVVPEGEIPLPTARSPESEVDLKRRASEVLTELDNLPHDQAAALVMHGLGFSHGEVGDALGCSADAARKRVARAQAALVRRRIAVED